MLSTHQLVRGTTGSDGHGTFSVGATNVAENLGVLMIAGCRLTEPSNAEGRGKNSLGLPLSLSSQMFSCRCVKQYLGLNGNSLCDPGQHILEQRNLFRAG